MTISTLALSSTPLPFTVSSVGKPSVALQESLIRDLWDFGVHVLYGVSGRLGVCQGRLKGSDQICRKNKTRNRDVSGTGAVRSVSS